MNIHQIAYRLNDKAVEEGFQIASLPELRKKYLGKKQLPNQIFTNKTVFDKTHTYAYHYGGRDEMQFNVGEEGDDLRDWTRYGLCFSLKASRSLTDPIKQLEPFRSRFNYCIEKHPEYFEGFEMWHFQNGERSENYSPRAISAELFQANTTFICLGKLIDKPLSELREEELSNILLGFDKLLPVYQFAVLDSPSILSKEKRIAKTCWNDNDWMYPSGLAGKSLDPNSHERKYGFGHEEWLFDFEKIIDGYHYALLQPVQRGREKYTNGLFDVRLYSSNSDTKDRSWIGFIKDLEVISNEDAKAINDHYRKNGWLDEMAQDIQKVNGDVEHFRSLKPHERFNVKFKPENAKLVKPYKLIVDFDKIIGIPRYIFVHDEETPTQQEERREKEKKRRRDFKFKPGRSDKSLKTRVSNREKKVVQSEPLHDKIQEILYDHLVEVYGEDNVGSENDTGLATRIDITVQDGGKIILYEVKSYPSVMISIRAALGQLLEYGYYPNPIENLKEMVIVSHLPIEPEDQEYLDLIRGTTKLDIFYQHVDIDSKKVSPKT
jgi:hypothetical protein